MGYRKETIAKLNQDIRDFFPYLTEIQPEDHTIHSGVSRLVMLDRYAQKDRELKTLGVGDIVLAVIKEDPKYPARGVGAVKTIDWENESVTIEIEEEFRGTLEDEQESVTGLIRRPFSEIDKPMEIYYEQIARRVGKALAEPENNDAQREKYADLFTDQLKKLNVIPAGRVLFGAGSGTQVTYFNCFVMPFVADSRGGIAEHRKEVMEIMSRGGGVGTNGSTLRPKHAPAKGVGGRSSGAVSWLNDIANLTNLVEQGGSRRGAQMIMLADWHPDIIEFIISKMQNPRVLKWLSENNKDEQVRELAQRKLKFIPLTRLERQMLETLIDNKNTPAEVLDYAQQTLLEGGRLEVVNPEFLSGANISVTLTDEFMHAVETDGTFDLRFPDIANYTPQQKEAYDTHWHKIGDVREWEALGYPIKTYRTIRARDLWDLICFCATYSAEPGIFFIDNANKMTNAKAYGQKVVATNPCGEQPLAPYSVCNLAAVNLANFVDKKTGRILFEELAQTVSLTVRMQDNVIDSTPYFLKANEDQALGERRVGLGVMGLHDMLIWNRKRYGSAAALETIDQVFHCIARTAYQTSVELAKEKGSFPFFTSGEAFINTGYMKQMDEDVRQDILKYGIRNSHLLTIAPTGSTGTMVGVSTGLEPYFSFSYFRSGRLGKFIEVNAAIVDQWLALNPGYTRDTLPEFFVSAMELTPEEHADTQCAIQRWIDSSISKTVNAPRGFSVRQVQGIYERLYAGGAKGGTVYVDGSRDSQVLTLSNEEENSWDQMDIERDFGVPVKKTQEAEKKTDLRADRQDRNIGVEVGDICPICLEGIVEEIGGCNTCTNCNAQLKCGL
ncbi:vitamin B12-dependent ribonucleotide reductase [Holdemania massiliensis]|uniref:Vitamin B12-dependent ribonucleotide reductase n=1 Tax=Holdemania massiliensis TaxID=1468449 RepID=A0A6N7S1J0_9FIRM|nr:vitamin B12-dependent ribonucleotide reductase [Holdemania massiliensis]MSA69510.1 vitamin B12-dependent ribonucleotide reductase [Holdemania massiliensis]MSA87721.1 vitamin B12-dependent ribonucleotide reductase [Holdemania massiliensis]MSB76591.1 vitamin B12-dependent ribonucleotide reductase [Holdemania massiliensis]MSC31515.1 vitamin B12-dependent ribonucleotide reductase [Holdemania massiliensis]MSC39490.1 vitamin B12-dependent ribonucleotide reductase [Holdemania massiliensis]